MKKSDLFVFIAVVIVFLPFFISNDVYQFYLDFNKEHGLLMSFIKFALLATFGECLGLRIKKGVYYEKGFGLLPRMIVWGLIGITIKIAFIIFTNGTLAFLEYVGLQDASEIYAGSFSGNKLLIAFCISAFMNLIFAPVFMTFHKITDTHILSKGGTLKGFFTPINFNKIFKELNWGVQWNFVFKKTIPFFWIPAHTITFLLPGEWQVFFAAILGIVLGVFLAISSIIGQKSEA
ncbi:MAG: hypothetical protein U9Q98_09270 [Bacteroidota bacterium]|nr:hypothetical protein [Bacteroidota bacterium]